MIRDDEISRLIKYAQGMGIKVMFSNTKKPDAAADWATDGTEITIYKRANINKTETILSLIHEIGHQLFFVHEKNRERDPKFERALDVRDHYEEILPDRLVPTKHRKKILDVERAGTLYWEGIYKETNMKFPLWKLHAQIEYDVYQYEIYAETGYFPTQKENRRKKKELNLKYKNMKYE